MASPTLDILTEDAISALIECLVDPSLANINHYAGSSIGEDDIAKQMEAVAWLYNQYLCEESPNLKPLDWLALRNKAVIIRPNLIKFMSLTKTSNSTLTLTETKIKNACAMTEALKNLNNSHESFPVSKVSVCLLNARRDKFVLVLGGVTGGTWSFIEKSSEIDLSKKPTGEENHSEEELAFMAIQEQTGIKTSLLQIEDSFLVSDCMNQAGGGTKFYIFSCFGTFDLSPAIKLKKIAWVSVNTALSNADGHLLEKTPSGVRSTSAVPYFHLRPFRYLVRNWFMRQFKIRNLEKSSDKSSNHSRDEKSTHTTLSGLVADTGLSMYEARRHVNDKSVSETVDVKLGHADENNGHSKSDAGMTSENASQCYKGQDTFYPPKNLARVTDFDESGMPQDQCVKVTVGGEPPKENNELGTFMCLDNIAGHNINLSLEASKKNKMDVVVPVAEVPHEPKDKTACTPKPEELFQVKARLSNQEINVTKLHMGLCECNPSPESSTQMRTKQGEHIVDDATGTSSQQAALRIVNEGRKIFSKELMDITIEYQTRVNRLNKRIAECDANLTTLLEGGKAAGQLALELCKNICQKQGFANDITIDQHETAIPGVSNDQREASAKKRCISKDPFQMSRSSMQELTEICMKNNWPSPSYGVFTVKNHQKQNLFSGKVRVRGSNFELSETGELCDSMKAAKASAAACMLSALYLVRSRGSIL